MGLVLGLGFTCLFIIFIYFLFGDKKFEKSELESWHEVLALMLVFIIYILRYTHQKAMS